MKKTGVEKLVAENANISPAMKEVRKIIKYRAEGTITGEEAIDELARVFPRLTKNEVLTLQLSMLYVDPRET